jgi:crotonobetainyl-CoA:carnitine CoA-transferase CaiB-like acyl-CoA transferase
VRNSSELDECMSEVLRHHSVAHWTAVLDRHDVANDPVQTPGQVLADPQVAALGQLEKVELAGPHSALLPRLPIGLSATPPRIQGPPPETGEHTDSILSEAGYSATEIGEFLRTGVCGVAKGEAECKF